MDDNAVLSREEAQTIALLAILEVSQGIKDALDREKEANSGEGV